MLARMNVIRNRYQFNRPLAPAEAELLSLLIGWRKGSSLAVLGESVIGCVAHPDDVQLFEKRMRRKGAKLEAMIMRD